MSLNLYDVLDVPEDATADQIRAAWKSAIADLDPTDRRFRAYNEAASTLLDGDRRASYDAELAAEREQTDAAEAAESEQSEQAAAEPGIVIDEVDGDDGVVILDREDGDSAPDDDVADPAVASDEESAEPDDAGDDEDDEDADEDDEDDEQASSEATTVPDWLLGAVGVLAVLSLALAVWVATWPGTFGDPSPGERKQMQRDVTSSEAAAERIAETVFSYDYRTLDDNFAQAGKLMTPKLAEDRAGLLDQLRPEVTSQRAIVVAAVRGTGVATISPDGNVAQVVVFVDQLVQKRGQGQQVLWQSATLRLIRSDGRWLLERICSTGADCGL